jgi:hypothetical protein
MVLLLRLLETKKNGFKIVDHVRWQGMRRLKSGAYTPVCEHFEASHNAAIGH